MGVTIFTVGHGTRSFDEFLDLLRAADIERLVDVRTFPGSRRHPHFGKDALAASLQRAGIAYEWMKDLGGFRKTTPDSHHVAIRNAGFRGYADHMETEAFRATRERLIDSAAETRTAVMCAESVWWRCHRRMLSDSLTAAGCDVRHLMDGGKQDLHRLHPAARLEGGVLVYDVLDQPQQSLLPEA
ncbi:MAG: DUF488 family protein [Actinomycetota bacterium]